MTKWIVGIVVLIIVAAGAFLLLGSKPAVAPTQPVASGAPSSSPQTNVAPTAGTAAVAYTDKGFSPQTVTIKAGGSVTFVNQSSRSMWVATNPHPAHTGYDSTSRSEHCAAGYGGPAPFDECGTAVKGGSYTFSFTKAGTWSYHNHAEADAQGAVIVTP